MHFEGYVANLIPLSLSKVLTALISPIVPIENILIVTNIMYRDQVLAQIPDLQSSQVLCEPARRNTAPCIAYAMARIKAMNKANAHANIVVAASDHLILQEEKFREIITTCFDFIEKNDALVTLGMKPTRPETGYGYIQFSGEGSLVEKLETAYRRDERVIRFLTFKLDKYALAYAEKRMNKLSNKSEEK